MAIVPAYIMMCLIAEDEAELAEILRAPLIQAGILMHLDAKLLRERGFEHPLGADWRGYQDIDPGKLTRERILDMLKKVDVKSITAIVPSGTPKQIARTVKGYVDAGLRVPKILDYAGMAGLKFGACSPEKVRQTEDELLRLCA